MLTHHETGSGLENEIRCSVGHKGLGIPHRDIPACANGNEGRDLGQPAGKAELLQSLHLELGTYPVASIHRAAEKGYSANFAREVFSDVRCACLAMRGFCGKRIMGSGERVDPLRRSGRKEYASCPRRTRRTMRATLVVGRATPLPRRR